MIGITYNQDVYNQQAQQGWLTDIETTLGDVVTGRWNPVDPNAPIIPAAGIIPFGEAVVGEGGKLIGVGLQGIVGGLATETIVALGLFVAAIMLAPTILKK